MKLLSGAVSISLYGSLLYVIAGIQSTAVSAADITAFRLTDYDAFIETRTGYKERRVQATNTETLTREPTTEREAGVRTEGYVYHPNLLNLSLSGSIFQDKRSFKLETTSPFGQSESETDTDNLRWNFAGVFNFLSKKPYPLTLHYSQANRASLVAAQTETINPQSTNYGFKLGLRKPFSPVNIRINGQRSTTQGESSLQLVDETSDLLSVDADHQFSPLADVDFEYLLTRRDSVSGSPNLPIQGRSFLSQRFNLRSKWKFGDQQQYRLTQFANLRLRDNPDLLTMRYSPSFNWTHSPRLNSSYNYAFNASENQGGAKSNSHSGSASAQYQISDRMFTNIRANAGHSELSSNAERSNYGISTSGSYRQPFSAFGIGGKLIFNAGISYDFSDQQAAIDRIDIIDESHTFPGIMRIALANEFVIDSTIVITNTGRTQTFVENLDYRLIVIGSRTTVERLVGGNILEGQEVLVSYAIDSGGTFSVSSLGTRFSANVSFARYYSVYLRYNDRMQSLESGIPSVRLNSSRVTEVGASANVPMPWWGLRVGGEANFIYRDEDINPSDSTGLYAFMHLPLPYRSNFRASTRWNRANNHNSPEDDRVTVFSASLNSQPFRLTRIAAEFNHEIDTGGGLETRRTYSRLSGSWRRRQLRISARVNYNLSTQGSVERDGLNASLTIRRDIW